VDKGFGADCKKLARGHKWTIWRTLDSDEVAKAVLNLCGRNGDCLRLDLMKLRVGLAKMVSAIDREFDDDSGPRR
jgi:hypothetical protein